jgi:hypothetical protein
MKYVIDDTHVIPDYLMNMSIEELEVLIEKLRAEERKKSVSRENNKARSSRPARPLA